MFSLPDQNVLVFHSLEFIFRVLPAFLLVYWLLPRRAFLYVLLLGSLLLYGMAAPAALALLLVVLGVNYMAAWRMGERPDPALQVNGPQRYKSGKRYIRRRNRKRKRLLVLVVLFDFGLLFLFKFSLIKMAMPLGISFYLFRIVSYMADVSNGKTAPERSLVKLGVYLCMFPVMSSGPITRYEQTEPQMKRRSLSLAGLEEGVRIFIMGLACKVLLADRIGILWNEIQVIGFESISTPLAWMGAFAYSLMLYFDFNGYSLMAVGVGRMFGFTLPCNFQYPYAARSFSQFWKRWHITLSRWFRDYLYIPLGGNRKGMLWTACNLLTVWLCTGIWHGAHWNFLLWGLFTWLILMGEKLWWKRPLEHSRVLSRLYMLFLVPLTWVIFAIPDLKELMIYFTRLFPVTGVVPESVNSADYLKFGNLFGFLLLAGGILSQPWPGRWYERTKKNPLWTVALVAVFWVCVYYLINAANNPFLYVSF